MSRAAFLIALAFVLAGCSRNERLAMIDQPIQSSLVAEVEAKSRAFATRNDLAFTDHIRDREGYVSLRNRDLDIRTTIYKERLRITASGTVKLESVELATRYINEVAPGGPHIISELRTRSR